MLGRDFERTSLLADRHPEVPLDRAGRKTQSGQSAGSCRPYLGRTESSAIAQCRPKAAALRRLRPGGADSPDSPLQFFQEFSQHRHRGLFALLNCPAPHLPVAGVRSCLQRVRSLRQSVRTLLVLNLLKLHSKVVLRSHNPARPGHPNSLITNPNRMLASNKCSSNLDDLSILHQPQRDLKQTNGR
jgi:hypothetical protein